MVEGGSLFGLIAALFALYLSQSRGVWLAFGIILAYVICYKAYFKPWKYIAVAILCTATTGAIYQTNQLVQVRVAEAVSDLNSAEKVRTTHRGACASLPGRVPGWDFWIHLWQGWARMVSMH